MRKWRVEKGRKMQPFRCLVVDDDQLSREMVISMLEGFANCDQARNGREAIDAFLTAQSDGNPYRLIVLDVLMPEMDGHEAAKVIRGYEQASGITPDKGVTIIVLSCLNTPKDIVQSYISAQSAAHLIKPVKKEKLLKSLRQLALID